MFAQSLIPLPVAVQNVAEEYNISASPSQSVNPDVCKNLLDLINDSVPLDTKNYIRAGVACILSEKTFFDTSFFDTRRVDLLKGLIQGIESEEEGPQEDIVDMGLKDLSRLRSNLSSTSSLTDSEERIKVLKVINNKITEVEEKLNEMEVEDVRKEQENGNEYAYARDADPIADARRHSEKFREVIGKTSIFVRLAVGWGPKDPQIPSSVEQKVHDLSLQAMRLLNHLEFKKDATPVEKNIETLLKNAACTARIASNRLQLMRSADPHWQFRLRAEARFFSECSAKLLEKALKLSDQISLAASA